MDKRKFWSSKSPLPEYHGITFDHPAFGGAIRLVANQFDSVTLGGNVHTPAPMTVQPPEQKGDTRPRLQIVFPRAIVGQEFKRKLALVAESGLLTPVTVNYDIYLGDTDVPQMSWDLYIADQSGVTFSNSSVQVTATDDNPMRHAVGVIYDPAVFTGLELI